MADRRSLLDGNRTPTQENLNIFDDAFEVEDFDGVADGFRPGTNHDREGGVQGDADNESLWRLSANYATDSVSPAGPSRNSTRKSRGQPNPFASPEDASTEQPLQRTPSGNFAPFAHRSVSSASSSQFARTDSPRFGNGGPSHPYGMYPQGTVARTPSVATTSTVRPQRRSSTQNVPRHPYALYTQGVGDDSDEDHEPAPNPVPVGFLGLGQAYPRRRGPDGEVQDIVGDYGHTEQLPPYTRYPEDGPEKAPLLPVPNPPPALHSHAPVLGTDPGNPIMHAQLQPVQQSMTDQSELARQPSNVSRHSTLLQREVSQPDSLDTDKSWSEKSWKQRRRTRVCGVRFLWILIAAGVFVFIASVLGGAMGGFFAGQKKGIHKAAAADSKSSSSMYDASLIATPTATSPPTGAFALSLGLPQETQASCLVKPVQQAAWSCDLAFNAEVAISISTPIGSNQSGASLYSASVNPDTDLYYGLQTSSLTTPFSPFLLVQDLDDPENGHAFYFQTQYDKVVVIPQDAIPGGYGGSKRSVTIDEKWYTQKAVSSDKPWFCFFNNTYIEGFIYPHEAAVNPLSSSTIPASSSATATGMPAWVTGPANATITTTLDLSTTTATYTGVASGLPRWVHDTYPTFNTSYWSPPEPPRPSRRKRDDDDGYDPDEYLAEAYYPYPDQGGLPQYPYLIKLEERRIPVNRQPYCVQYQVLDNGVVNFITDDNGDQIVVHLDELDPGEVPARRMFRSKRDVLPGECHCQWMAGAKNSTS